MRPFPRTLIAAAAMLVSACQPIVIRTQVPDVEFVEGDTTVTIVLPEGDTDESETPVDTDTEQPADTDVPTPVDADPCDLVLETWSSSGGYIAMNVGALPAITTVWGSSTIELGDASHGQFEISSDFGCGNFTIIGIRDRYMSLRAEQLNQGMMPAISALDSQLGTKTFGPSEDANDLDWSWLPRATPYVSGGYGGDTVAWIDTQWASDQATIVFSETAEMEPIRVTPAQKAQVYVSNDFIRAFPPGYYEHVLVLDVLDEETGNVYAFTRGTGIPLTIKEAPTQP